MLPPEDGLGLPALCERAGVSVRTVRYYLQLGLLLPPDRASWPAANLDRLAVIRQLQRQHLPLAEIRRRLDGLGEREVGLLARSMPDPSTEYGAGDHGASSASDYVRSVLGAGGSSRASEPPPQPYVANRAVWERIHLSPDLELHVRRPLDRQRQRQLERLLAFAQQLLQENAP